MDVVFESSVDICNIIAMMSRYSFFDILMNTVDNYKQDTQTGCFIVHTI